MSSLEVVQSLMVSLAVLVVVVGVFGVEAAVVDEDEVDDSADDKYSDQKDEKSAFSPHHHQW